MRGLAARNFFEEWRVRLGGWDWPAIALVLGIKALIFIFAFNAVRGMEMGETRDWKEIWLRWDAVHYVRIALDGYVAVGDARNSLAFFPLFPWLIRAFSWLTGGPLGAALLVSGLASIATALLLKKLARLDESEAFARRALWFLLIFPTTYFLHVIYTEGLFLALVLACFFAARTDRWAAMGICGALATLTRVNGLLLLPAMAVEIFLRWRERGRFDARWLWLALMPLGFGVYLYLNYQTTGDWFAFLAIQKEHWYKGFAPPWVGIAEVYDRIGDIQPMESSHELFFILFGLAATILCAQTMRASYAIWMAGNWLLFTSTAFIVSVPRFTLTLFPIYFLLARWTRGRREATALLSVASILYLGFYIARFARGLWAF